MTVSPGYAPNTVTADGSTRYWPITFEYADVDEIKIRSIDSSGTITQINLNYFVDHDNARVVYPTVASGLPLVESGIQIVVYRQHEIEQTYDATVSPFNSQSLNSALDSLTRRMQELTSSITTTESENQEIIHEIADLQSSINSVESLIASHTGEIASLAQYDASNTGTIQYILAHMGEGGGGGGGGGGVSNYFDLLNDCGCLPGADSSPVLLSWFTIHTEPLSLFIPSLTFEFITNFTFPENVKSILFNPSGNAVLSPRSGVVLTFTGQYIDAESNNKIFGVLGDLAGSFKNDQVKPEWWGAISNSLSDNTEDYIDCTTELRKCFLFAGKTSWQPEVFLSPPDSAPIYYCSAPIISTSDINLSIRVRGRGLPDAKNSEGRNSVIIEMGTSDNDNYIFNCVRDNWNYAVATYIQNISFRLMSGGGILNYPGGYSGRALLENLNVYGMARWLFPTVYGNSLYQVLGSQKFFNLVDTFGVIVRNFTFEGGWICFNLIDTDDMRIDNIRGSCPIVIHRSSLLGPWENGQQLNITNMETEQSIAYIINKYGRINIDGWHEERNPDTGHHHYDLSGVASIYCSTTAHSNVLTFNAIMEGILHPDMSVIRVSSPYDDKKWHYFIVKTVSENIVTVYANTSENDNSLSVDVWWTESDNLVERCNSYIYLGIPQAPPSPPGICIKNYYGDLGRETGVDREPLLYLFASNYGRDFFMNCFHHEQVTNENGVFIMGNRIGDNNDSAMSNNPAGAVFIGCDDHFLPKQANHPYVTIVGPDLSLGNTIFPNGRGKNKSTIFEKKVLDRSYFFAIKDLYNRIGWAGTHRYNIVPVGEPGTDQSYMAAFGTQMHLEDFKFPNHACYLRFRLLAFTVPGSGSLTLTLSASGKTGNPNFQEIIINETMKPIEFLIKLPENMIDRNMTNECIFFIAHSTVSFYFVACEITEELNPYLSGDGNPQNAVYAPPGTFYMNRDGGEGTCVFVKETGTNKLGWAVIGKPPWYDMVKDAACVSGTDITSALAAFFQIHNNEPLGLYIPKGTFYIGNDYNFPAFCKTIMIDPAGSTLISVNSGKTLTFNRQFLDAPPQNRIFGGDGNVSGMLFNEFIYTEWFGTSSEYFQSTKENYTDQSPYLRKCFSFANNGNWQPIVKFMGNGDKSIYYCSTPILKPRPPVPYEWSSASDTIVLVGDFADTIVGDPGLSKTITRYSQYSDPHWSWEIVTNSTDTLATEYLSGSTLRLKLANTTPSKNSASSIQTIIRALGYRAADGTHLEQDFSRWTIKVSAAWESSPPIAASSATGATPSGKGVYTIDNTTSRINLGSYLAYVAANYEENVNFKIVGRTAPGGVKSDSESVIIESGLTDDTEFLFDVQRQSWAYQSPITIKDICIKCPQGGGALIVNGHHGRFVIDEFETFGHAMSTYTDFMANGQHVPPGTQTLVKIINGFGLDIKKYSSIGGFYGLSLIDCDDTNIDFLTFIETPVALVIDTLGSGNSNTNHNNQINIKTLKTSNCVATIIHKYGMLNIDNWHHIRNSTADSHQYSIDFNTMSQTDSDPKIHAATSFTTDSVIPDLSVVAIRQPSLDYEYYVVKSVDNSGITLYTNSNSTDDTYSQTIHGTRSGIYSYRLNSYAYLGIPKVNSDPPCLSVRNFYGDVNNSNSLERIMFVYTSGFTMHRFDNCRKIEVSNMRLGVYLMANRIMDNNSTIESNSPPGAVFSGCNEEFLPTLTNHPFCTIIGPDLSFGNTLYPDGRGKNKSTVFERKLIDRSYFFGLKDIFNRLGWIGSNRYPIVKYGEPGTDQAYLAAYGQEMHLMDFKYPNHACYLRIKLMAYTAPSSGALTLQLDAHGTSTTNNVGYITINEDTAIREIIIANPSVMIGRTMSNESFFVIRNTTTAFYFVAAEIIEELDLRLSGNGSPEGVVYAPVGCMYLRKDGSTSTTLYIKESGSGNTGWVAK